MSQYGPGDRPPTVKKAKKAKRVATGSRGDSGSGLDTPKVAKPLPIPKTDVQSSGGDYGTKKATDFKATPAYRGATRDAYDALTPRQRRQRLAEAQARGRAGKATPEDITITKLHNERSASSDRQDAAEQAYQGQMGHRTAPKPGLIAQIMADSARTKAESGHDVVHNEDLKTANTLLRQDAADRTDQLDKEREKEARKAATPQQLFKTGTKQQKDAIFGDPQKDAQDPAVLAKFVKDSAAQAHAGAAALPFLPIVVGKDVATTIYHDPKKQLPKLASDTAKSIIGAPAGIVDIAAHPVKGAQRVAADYQRRYGDLFKPGGEKKFKERLKKEGVTPEVFDLGTVAGAAGAGSVVTGAGRALLGDVARPALRLSGKVVQEQAQAGKITRIIGGRAADKARAIRQARRAAAPEAPAHIREAVAKGELTPFFERGPIGRRRKVRRIVAREKAIAHIRQRTETDAEVNAGAGKNLAHLRKREGKVKKYNTRERVAFKYAMQLGLPKDVSVATRELRAHRDAIVAYRKANPDVKIIPKQDELPVIDDILANPEKAFTPRVFDAVTEEKTRGARLAESDPGISTDTAAERRAAPQAIHLGVERGGVPVDEALATAEADLKQAKKARKKTGKAVTRQERQAGRSQGSAEVRVSAADRAAEREMADAQRAVAMHDRSAQNFATRASRVKHAIRTDRKIKNRGVDPATMEPSAEHAFHVVDDSGNVISTHKSQLEAAKELQLRPEDLAPTNIKLNTHRYPDALNELEAMASDELGPTIGRLRSKTITPEDAAKTVKVLDSELADGGLLTKEGRLEAGETAANATKIERQATKLRDEIRANQTQTTLPHKTAAARRAELQAKAAAATVRADNARARLAEIQKKYNRKPVGSLRVAERNEGEALARSKAVERADAEVAQAKQARKVARRAKRKGERLVNAEPLPDYLGRVKAEADARGLDEPGYYPSQKRPEGVFSAYATGGSSRAATPKEYTGELFKSGRESTDPTVYTTALATNIKRKYNWNMVAKNFNDHSYDWSVGKTIGEIKDELTARHIDTSTVAFWNPKIFRKAQEKINAADATPEITHGEELGNAHVNSAVQQSAVDWTRLETDPDMFNKRGGWSVIPKEVYDEIMAETRPSGGVARSYDIAKGKASRLLLGNPAWLTFQTAANGLLTGITGTGPVDAIKAQIWWKRLSQAEKDAVEPYIGVHSFHDEQTRLGAASNLHFVNAYRGLKQTTLWRKAHKLNPLDAIFRADNAQNNFFRRAVFYNEAKRQAYQRMGESTSKIMTLQDRLVNSLGLGPKAQMSAALQDMHLIEEHAHYVNEMLGDYMTYTAKERRALGRGVMFYGFLRYSLRFMFYTMPAKHPIVANTMLQLGRLHHDELVKLFGVEPPPWDIGNYYSPDGKMKIAAMRANPFFNAAQFLDLDTGNLKANQLIGVLPPWVQAVANQIAGKNIFMNKNWKLGGSTAEDRKGVVNAKVFLADFMKGLGSYYTIASKLDPKLRGDQSADSSIFFPDPTKYSQEAAKARNRTLIKQQDKSAGQVIREGLGPVADARADIAKARAFSKGKPPKKGRKAKSPLPSLGGVSGSGLPSIGGSHNPSALPKIG